MSVMSKHFLVDSPRTLWLTGLSGAGKTTLAKGLHDKFQEERIASVVLDGDLFRSGMCSDLGFSERDRSENIRRVSEVARLFNSAGLHVIVAFISPFSGDRERARALIGTDRFIEIHVATPLITCEARDPKGLYARARRQELLEFTGVSSPYEPPLAPHISIDTTALSIHEAVGCLRTQLASEGWV